MVGSFTVGPERGSQGPRSSLRSLLPRTRSVLVLLLITGCLIGCEREASSSSTSDLKGEVAANMSFGSCCKDLHDAMTVPNSAFRVEDNGVLYLTVGHVQTEQGQGQSDSAVLYCPFCGRQLQEKDEIARKAR